MSDSNTKPDLDSINPDELQKNILEQKVTDLANIFLYDNFELMQRFTFGEQKKIFQKLDDKQQAKFLLTAAKKGFLDDEAYMYFVRESLIYHEFDGHVINKNDPYELEKNYLSFYDKEFEKDKTQKLGIAAKAIAMVAMKDRLKELGQEESTVNDAINQTKFMSWFEWALFLGLILFGILSSTIVAAFGAFVGQIIAINFIATILPVALSFAFAYAVLFLGVSKFQKSYERKTELAKMLQKTEDARKSDLNKIKDNKINDKAKEELDATEKDIDEDFINAVIESAKDKDKNHIIKAKKTIKLNNIQEKASNDAMKKKNYKSLMKVFKIIGMVASIVFALSVILALWPAILINALPMVAVITPLLASGVVLLSSMLGFLILNNKSKELKANIFKSEKDFNDNFKTKTTVLTKENVKKIPGLSIEEKDGKKKLKIGSDLEKE